MAEEKNIIFAVLAVIVLVTAVGLVYMMKAGPGRATESMFAPMGGDLVPGQTPQFTIAPPTYTITQPRTPSTTSFLSDMTVALDNVNQQNTKTYTFFVQPKRNPTSLYVITLPFKDAQSLANQRWIGAGQITQRINSIKFYNSVPTNTLDGLTINDQSFKASLGSAVTRLNSGGTYATASDTQSPRIDIGIRPPVLCATMFEDLLADLQAIIDMCK